MPRRAETTRRTAGRRAPRPSNAAATLCEPFFGQSRRYDYRRFHAHLSHRDRDVVEIVGESAEFAARRFAASQAGIRNIGGNSP